MEQGYDRCDDRWDAVAALFPIMRCRLDVPWRIGSSRCPVDIL